MLNKIIGFFDKFEDKTRAHLSRFPILYTIIGSVAIVLFWRGVWHTADILQERGGFLGFIFYEPINMVLVALILLATGLFVSYFIGDSILITGVRSEKKLAEKNSRQIRDEEATLNEIKGLVSSIKQEVDEIKREVEEKK